MPRAARSPVHRPAPSALRAGVVLASAGLASCLGLATPPTLLVGAHSARHREGDTRFDHGFTISLASSMRAPALRAYELALPESHQVRVRTERTRCDHAWLCAWERIHVTRSLVALELGR